MAGFVNTFFEERVDQLFSLAGLVEKIFSGAGLDYCIIGGLATYLYVEEAEPDAGRLTKDIDIAVCHEDLERITKAAEPHGLELRHAAGIDMLVPVGHRPNGRAIYLHPTPLPAIDATLLPALATRLVQTRNRI